MPGNETSLFKIKYLKNYILCTLHKMQICQIRVFFGFETCQLATLTVALGFPEAPAPLAAAAFAAKGAELKGKDTKIPTNLQHVYQEKKARILAF